MKIFRHISTIFTALAITIIAGHAVIPHHHYGEGGVICVSSETDLCDCSTSCDHHNTAYSCEHNNLCYEMLDCGHNDGCSNDFECSISHTFLHSSSDHVDISIASLTILWVLFIPDLEPQDVYYPEYSVPEYKSDGESAIPLRAPPFVA